MVGCWLGDAATLGTEAPAGCVEVAALRAETPAGCVVYDCFFLHLFDGDPLCTFPPSCKAGVIGGSVVGGVEVVLGLSIKVCLEL